RRHPHVADPVEAQAQVTLPAGIARIGSGELAPDGEAFLIEQKRARPVARCLPLVADPVEAEAHVALRFSIAWIGRGELAPQRAPLPSRGATRTPPPLSRLRPRSRCHSALPGSDAASLRLIARLSS